MREKVNKFAEKLKELRIDRSLTQSQLAKECDLSRSAIEHWESNKRIPNLDAVIALADFFGVSIDFLVGRDE